MGWVRSRHDAVGEFEVGDAGGEGAVDAACCREVECGIAGDAAVRGLEAVCAAVAGRDPDGAAGVRAEGERDEAGADGVGAAA